MKKLIILYFISIPGLCRCQVKVGDHYAGGIVFYLDSTGQHGQVLAEGTVGSFTSKDFRPSVADTIVMAGYSDWVVPSGSQMATVYQNIRKDRNMVSVLGGGTFWTSTVSSVDLYDTTKKVYRLYSLTQGYDKGPDPDLPIAYPIKPIRKF